jgi:hypothetical protein
MLSYLTTCFCSLRAALRQIAMLPAAAGARIGINTYRTMQTFGGHCQRNAMPAVNAARRRTVYVRRLSITLPWSECLAP